MSIAGEPKKAWWTCQVCGKLKGFAYPPGKPAGTVPCEDCGESRWLAGLWEIPKPKRKVDPGRAG